MNGRAYYNELDPDAAAVLRALIADDVIAPGDVDERSIRDVHADDLRGYTQVHLFAGGGLWSVAARLAGWPDNRRLWTGSCPCQPYSAAGKRTGDDDPRNLWPDFLRLVRGAGAAGDGPPVIMGEQVSQKAGYGWFDGVRADLEAEGYASRARDIPACAVDAPHQRNRLYWVAVADPKGQRSGGKQPERRQEGRTASRWPDEGGVDLVDASGERRGEGRPQHTRQLGQPSPAGSDASGVTQGDAFLPRLEGHAGHGNGRPGGSEPHRPIAEADGGDGSGAMADSDIAFVQGQPPTWQQPQHQSDARTRGRNGSWWADAEWIICHDGKARRTKPGLRLLVDGLPGRVGLWRVGGNAISPILAAEVIGAFLEAETMSEAA